MEALDLFMHLYMFQLENYLNDHREAIQAISFQLDEANTDRPLKEHLKGVIENDCCQLSDRFHRITLDGSRFTVYPQLQQAQILRVLLPEDITPEIRDLLAARKKGVYTKPDICLEIQIDEQIVYIPVELKTTKTDAILGSSVQQVSAEEWVIFIKHTRTSVEVTTGQYFHAINAKMPFPDRSPRPQVSFRELKNWNEAHRQCIERELFYSKGEDEDTKRALLEDWQGVLVEDWKEVLFDFSERSAPWFHHTLRRFVLSFLSAYDQMDPAQKEAYKEALRTRIED